MQLRTTALCSVPLAITDQDACSQASLDPSGQVQPAEAASDAGAQM